MADENKEFGKSKEAKRREGNDDGDAMKVESDEDGEAEESGRVEKNDGEKDSDKKKPTETTAKKKITNWPMRDIKEPSPNDVLFGRGGGTNHHPGNKRYRKMVEDRKLDYVNCKRLDKPLVALGIIREWRAQDPPGRFLKLDEKTGLWEDVGDKKAREKTSQALREKAPLIRKQQEEEKMSKGKGESGEKSGDSQDEEAESEPVTKSTRFAEGTNEEKKGVKKAVLARDHSLGREYIPDGEAVSLDGFSWQAPIETDERVTSHGSLPPPPSHSYPSGRTGSQGSIGAAPPDFRIQSHGSIGGVPPPPPPPDFYGHMSSGDYLRTYSSGHFESWGPMSSFGSLPPPPPSLPGYPSHGSWTREPSLSREHSLSGNHLRDASINHPAPPTAFDSRTGSGYWGDPSLPPHGPHGPPPPPPPHHGSLPSHYSPREGPPGYRPNHGVGGSYGHTPTQGSGYYRSNNGSNPPSPSYDVDLGIAKTWSGGQEVKATGSFESYGKTRYDHSSPGSRGGYDESMDDSDLPRPCMVKRATSNQNETLETKKDLKGPSVKRAALNRDNSLASNRLKEKYVPGYQEEKTNGAFDPEKEMNILSNNLEQSTLSTSQPKPKPLRPEERISTLDHIAMDLMTRPIQLTESSRSSTIDALALEFNDDPILDRVALERTSTSESISTILKEGLPRPSCLTSENRLSTMEFLRIINEPLEEEVDEYLDKPLDFNRESSGATGECFTSV